MKRIKAEEEQYKKTIEQEVSQWFLTLKESLKMKEIARKNVEQTSLNLEIMNEKYDLGLAEMIELQDAEILCGNANVDYIQAEYDLRINAIKLNNASGLEFWPM